MCILYISVDSEDRKEEVTLSGLHSNRFDDSDDDDDAVDYFDDIPPDEEGGAVHYADFFDPPGEALPHDGNEYDYGIGDSKMADDEEEEGSMDSDFELRLESEKVNELEVETEDEEADSSREDADYEEEGASGVLSSHEERLARVSTA